MFGSSIGWLTSVCALTESTAAKAHSRPPWAAYLHCSGMPADLAQARTASARSNEDDGRLTYWDMMKASPFKHQVFVAVVALQCVCILLERILLYALADRSDADFDRESIYFFIVIAVSTCFVFYFAVHSILQCNAFETGAFFFSCCMLLARLAAEASSGDSECYGNEQIICIVFLVLGCTFVVAAMLFTVSIAKDLQWKRYKALGAQPATRNLYRLFELFSAVRKLDMQFSLLTLITGIVFFGGQKVSSASPATYALVVNALLFVVEIAWDRTGDEGIKREDSYLLFIFWALSLFLPVFIITVAADVVTDNILLVEAKSPNVKFTILVMAVLTLLNRVATVAVSALLYRSFGEPYQGLKRLIGSGDRKTLFNRHRVRGAAGAPLPEGSYTESESTPAASKGTAMVVGGGAAVTAVAVNPFTAATASAGAGVAQGFVEVPLDRGESARDWGATASPRTGSPPMKAGVRPGAEPHV